MTTTETQAHELAGTLLKAVDGALPQLQAIDNLSASKVRTAGKWSKKEILGHLIDSASNNHQRFIRAQYTKAFHFPPYAQDDWVRIQHYREREWTELIELWSNYNRHLAHVIRNLPRESGEILVWVGDDPPMSLRELAEDYVRHLLHHLRQIL
jgi:hypothetical protein